MIACKDILALCDRFEAYLMPLEAETHAPEDGPQDGPAHRGLDAAG
jgi:hypothetical protein